MSIGILNPLDASLLAPASPAKPRCFISIKGFEKVQESCLGKAADPISISKAEAAAQ